MNVVLSSPGPNSVNHGIPEDQCSLHYALMDDTLKLIRSLVPDVNYSRWLVRTHTELYQYIQITSIC